MVSRDYTKELGLKSSTKQVSWPIAVLILAAVAGLVWFGISRLEAGDSHRSQHADVATPAATAHN